ncbi:MAG: Crp/Fnr family transcriptional regulator [Magnetovibrio sp.]|nr:Crp/Fnr family transcriptional regulator [Magnetovibrio sp.]
MDNGRHNGTGTKTPLLKPTDLELLRINDLLIGLDDDEFHVFAGRCEFRAISKGDVLVESGADQNEVFFIIRGEVRIVQDDQGVNVVYSKVSEGGWFGEIAAIDKGVRSANAFALTDGMVAVADRALFLNLILEHRQIAVRVLESFATVVRSTNRRLSEVSSFSGVQRVYLKLIELVDETPTKAGTWVITEMPSHEQLSAMASTSKETVTRALSQLQKSEVARRSPGQLEIINLHQMKKMATEV